MPPPTVVRSEAPVPNPAMPQIPSHCSGIHNPYTFTSEPVSVALPSTSLVESTGTRPTRVILATGCSTSTPCAAGEPHRSVFRFPTYPLKRWRRQARYR